MKLSRVSSLCLQLLERSGGLLQQHSPRNPRMLVFFFFPVSFKWLNMSDSCSMEAEHLDFSFCTLSSEAEGGNSKAKLSASWPQFTAVRCIPNMEGHWCDARSHEEDWRPKKSIPTTSGNRRMLCPCLHICEEGWKWKLAPTPAPPPRAWLKALLVPHNQRCSCCLAHSYSSGSSCWTLHKDGSVCTFSVPSLSWNCFWGVATPHPQELLQS